MQNANIGSIGLAFARVGVILVFLRVADAL